MTTSPSLLAPLRDRLSSPVATYGALAALVAGAGLLASFAPQLTSTAVLAAYAALFGPYLLLTLGAEESQVPFWVLVAAALLARAVFLPATSLLSDDIFRYVWDGRVGLSGINPFVHPPNADALAHLRDQAIWANVNHPDVPTIYPPGAQYLFQFNALLGGGVAGLKALFVAIEAGCVAAVWRLLAGSWSEDRLRFAFIAYALNPLIFIEVAWSGHIDVVAWALLAVGIAAWQAEDSTRNAVISAVAIGTSIAVKFLGLLALPLLLFDRSDESTPNRHAGRRIGVCAAAVGILVSSYIPMAGAGSELFSGFGTYASSWRGNDGGFRLVHSLSRSTLESWATPDQRSQGEVLIRFRELDPLYRRLGWTKTWQGETVPDSTFVAERFATNFAKATAVFVLALALLWAILGRRRPLDGLSLLLLALFVFAPVVHPWYVAWLVPFAALRGRATGLVFSFTVLAAYLGWRSHELGGPWRVPDWAVALEYGAVLAVFWLESALETDEPRADDEP